MKIYFIGICGTAMGNGALLLREMGYSISGSDENIYPPMSDLLLQSGVTLYSGYDPKHLQEELPDLVVIGNAMSRGNAEVEYTLEKRIEYISLAEALKRFVIKNKESIVVTGTHGKTTTSSLMAWTFEVAEKDPTFLIGGIPENFSQGYQSRPESNYVILEGDEYDTAFFDKRSKFLHYLPTTLIINNIEFDHADIFSSLDEIVLAFKRCTLQVPCNGIIICNGDDATVMEVVSNSFAPVTTVGFSSSCDLRAEQIRIETTSEGESHTVFQLIERNTSLGKIELALLGEFNVRNALAVIAAALHHSIPMQKIREAMKSFKNVKRRLEQKGGYSGITVYDDFAHHPTAIRETLHALRTKYPTKRIIALFEPRSNTTRRNIFQQELADCFAEADIVFISQIARLHLLSEEERLDPEKVMATIRSMGKEAFYLPDAETISNKVAEIAAEGDIIIVMSNGSFAGIHQLLKEKLSVK